MSFDVGAHSRAPAQTLVAVSSRFVLRVRTLETDALSPHEPLILSHSRLRDYLSCPRRYLYAHVLKLEMGSGPSLLKGSLLHEVLRQFHDTRPSLDDFPKEDARILMDRILHEKWTGVPAGSEDPPGMPEGRPSTAYQDLPPTALERESLIRSATRALQSYLDAEYERTPRGRAICLEKKFRTRIEGIQISGRIDRIDLLPDGGIQIIDYKSGRASFSVSAKPRRGRSRAETVIKEGFINIARKENHDLSDFQSIIYVLACRQDPELPPPKLFTYYYLGGDKESRDVAHLDIGLPGHDGGKFHITESELEESVQNLVQVAREIEASSFSIEPRSDWECNFCPYEIICDRPDEGI